MTIGSFLDTASKQLLEAGIASARLDCLVLLGDALQLDRAHIIAHPETEIPHSTEVKLNNEITQRSTHKPLAYIRGHAEFYGRDFAISPAVLVPRPETESIINLAKEITLPASPTIVDVGTGSGCIGVTLALEVPGSQVSLCDIDKKALHTARVNANKFGVNAISKIQDLLPPEARRIDLLVANLPYVPTALPINKAASFEPKIALFSGSDGLDHYRRLWRQLETRPASHAVTESLPSQHRELQKLAKNAGYQLVATQGFAQHFSLSGRRQA